MKALTNRSGIAKLQGVAIIAIILVAAIAGGYYYSLQTKKEEVTLNIFLPTLPELPVIKAALPEFEKKTGIKVNVEATEQMAMLAKAIVAFQGKTGAYDLLLANAYAMPTLRPYAEPLDPYIEKHNVDTSLFFQRTLNEMFTFDGQILGFPLIITGRVCMYNEDLLTKYGKKVPETYPELLETARFFTKKFNPDSPTEYGAVFGGVRYYLDVQWKAGLWANGGEWSDENWNPTFNSAEGVAALQFLVDLAECAPPGIASFSIAEPTAMFANEEVPISLNWNTQIFKMENASYASVAGKAVYRSMPKGPTGLGPINPTSCWGAIIPADSKHKDEAIQLLAYLASPELQSKFLFIGSTPVLPSVYQDPENRAELENIFSKGYADAVQYNVALAEQGRLWSILNPSHPGTIPEYTEIVDAEGAYLQMAITKEMTPQEALDAAVEKVSEILRESGYLK